MNKNRALILSLAMVFILACSLMVSPQSTQQPVLELPTYTPYPTYTPQPTYTSVAIPTGVNSSSQPTSVTNPSYDLLHPTAKLVLPNETFNGTTKNAAEMLYFNGENGKRVTIILTGINHYQTFTIRDDKDKSLTGCKIDSQTVCSITGYELPYTGIFYILVDRTRDPRYENNSNCLNAGANAWPWCFISGPYSLVLSFE